METKTSGASRWFPVSTLAAVIGVSSPNFRATILPLLPPEAVRQGRPILIHGPAVIDVVLLREGQRRGAKDTQSAALEEIRQWEAKRRELKYRQESGEWIATGDVERGFMVMAEILRRAGEAIRVEYGEAAARILSNAWDDVDAKLDALFAVRPDEDHG